MRRISEATALFAAMVLFAAIAAGHGENKSDSSMQGSSPGGQQSQQQSSPAMNDQRTVQQVQHALNAKGYNAGQANGNWSSASRDAMTQFQKDNGLKPTGRIDQQSLALLGVPAGSSSSGAGGQQQNGSGGYGMMGNQQQGSGEKANPD